MSAKLVKRINIVLAVLILILFAAVKVQASTQSMASFANNIPIGMVIDWWWPDAGTPIPDGYLICDASVINDPSSPVNGETLPNLTDKYVRGYTNPNDFPASGFTTGGSSSHTHNVNPPGHTHTIPNHPSQSGTATDASSSTNFWGTGTYSVNFAKSDHNHSYSWSWEDGGESGSYNFPQQATTSATYLPPYVGLLKLCKVK